MPLTAKQMLQLLQKNGFVIERTNGSHIFLRNSQTGKTTTVPLHARELKVGIEQKILKDAGLK